nr:PH domain-containing protein [Pseudomonadota bacterium]
MSYIDESLIEGETIIHRARVSWWSQFGLLVLGVVLLVVVVGLFFIIAAWIAVRSTEIAITN